MVFLHNHHYKNRQTLLLLCRRRHHLHLQLLLNNHLYHLQRSVQFILHITSHRPPSASALARMFFQLRNIVTVLIEHTMWPIESDDDKKILCVYVRVCGVCSCLFHSLRSEPPTSHKSHELRCREITCCHVCTHHERNSKSYGEHAHTTHGAATRGAATALVMQYLTDQL
jgi:hypothetical protein